MINKKSVDIADLIRDENFDMDPEEIRQFGYHATDIMVDYFKNIRDAPILPVNTLKQMKKLIEEPLPQTEQNPRFVLDDCKEKIIANAVLVGNPRFLGIIARKLGWTHLCSAIYRGERGATANLRPERAATPCGPGAPTSREP